MCLIKLIANRSACKQLNKAAPPEASIPSSRAQAGRGKNHTWECLMRVAVLSHEMTVASGPAAPATVMKFLVLAT